MRTITGLFGLGLLALGCATDLSGEPVQARQESALRARNIQYAGTDITAPPAGYDLWGPLGVTNRGDVFGSALDCDDEFVVCRYDLVRLSSDGTFTVVVQNFSTNDVNAQGDVGGCVLEGDTAQAAVVRSNGRVELIPRVPGEVSSCIGQISDNETALVTSFDENSQPTQYVRRNRQSYPFTLEAAQVKDINNRGQIAGIIATENGDRAFRFDAPSQTTTILEPIEGDPNSWGMGINRQGEVLGYSFAFDGTERIGAWDQNEEFETFFVEGTPEFPTVSNQLIWNEREYVVVSYTTDGNTYIIPGPGVRLNLADLVNGAAVPSTLFAFSINERGDFVAQSVVDGSLYLYRRTR